MTKINLDLLTVSDYLDVMDYPETGNHRLITEILDKVTPDISILQLPYPELKPLLIAFAAELMKSISPGDYILKFARIVPENEQDD